MLRVIDISLSHSSSLTVIRNDILEQGMCKSVLVLRYNYVFISHRFGDTEHQIMALPGNMGERSFMITENGIIRKFGTV